MQLAWSMVCGTYQKYPDAQWYVLGDDDTVFVIENLLLILNERSAQDLVMPCQRHILTAVAAASLLLAKCFACSQAGTVGSLPCPLAADLAYRVKAIVESY